MRTTHVPFRGELVEVKYLDHGYEPDTNAHEIDWHFTDSDLNAKATDQEQDAIYNRLVELSWESDCED